MSIKNSSNKGVENIATSMVEIKRENRMLKRRIEHLELQISHLTNHFDYQGNIEPTRTLVNSKKDSYMNNPDNFMMDQSPITYYENGGFPQNLNYNNAPSNQNMRSTGFSRGKSKMNSKGSLRDSTGNKGRRDMSMRNGGGQKSKNTHLNMNVDYSMNGPTGIGMFDEPLPPAFAQGQGSYTNSNNMMVMKVGNNKTPLKDKDEALKMLYNMMMTRVQKKRHTNY
uniref:Uncharacterized protein n=1 Tax=Euplotes harpa TaxID=151035 RepID=A0A7S3NCP5_9SPIT|mmetsp:Transcript_37107/g.42629  ORF Transcript_37107/g.42629 Transcript_37107/m.42629 type:complete len:225 (+) Transcript_37107:985-1659(+)